MKSFLKIFLTLLPGGGRCFRRFQAHQDQTPRPGVLHRRARPPLVEIVAAEAAPGPVEVTAMGTVVPSRRLIVQPEVSGRVTSSHEALVPGGRIYQGEEIVRIDARTYELAVEQQKAAVAKADVELELEAGRRILAEEEWKLFESEVPFSDEGRRLALRKPQERNAEIGIEVARTGLRQAELNVGANICHRTLQRPGRRRER